MNYSKELWQKGIKDTEILRDSALKILEGLDVDYVEIVDPDSFEDYKNGDKRALMLVAAKIPPVNTRLIDNMEL